MDKLLTPRELASRWKVAPKTIYQKISNGDDMPRSLKLGSRRRFRLSDVLIWEKGNEEETNV